MPEITRESIEPLLASHEVDGAKVACVFRCPDSGEEFPAEHTVKREKTIASVATDSVKKGLMRSVRRSIFGAARSLFGSGIAGRAANDALREADRQASAKGKEQAAAITLSEEEVDAAILAAFQTVSSRFAWDDAAGRWAGAKAAQALMTAFAVQLMEHPVTVPYDRAVLDRMLVEIAMADGELEDEEAEMLGGFVTTEGGVDAVKEKAKLSGAELAETKEGETRATMLMMAFAVALTDEDLEDEEVQRLNELGAGLGLDEAAIEQAKHKAQCFVVDQAVGACHGEGGDVAPAMALAESIGLATADAEQVEVRYRKRNHLF